MLLAIIMLVCAAVLLFRALQRRDMLDTGLSIVIVVVALMAVLGVGAGIG